MPILLPPTQVDVPAVIRIAAHERAAHVQVQHPMTHLPKQAPAPAPNSSSQGPTFVEQPPAPVPPPVPTAPPNN